tara:strand:- start:33 stop:959 length:927 start_codon:yes stop_codon:yes gene_type:complete
MNPQQFLFPHGVLSPILTPLTSNYRVDVDLLVNHAHKVLNDGCVGIVPFGTTGEALSVGREERIASLEALVKSDIDPSKLLVGTGQTNLDDTLILTRHAVEMNSAGVLVLPPFYYKNPSEEGLYKYFASLIDRINDYRLRVFLYHIPQVAGVGFPISVVQKLFQNFPKVVAGIKDSSGNWENTKLLLEIEGLDVYPGSERTLLDALSRNSRGCITATANVAAPMLNSMIAFYQNQQAEKANQVHSVVMKFREVLEKYPPIAALKSIKEMQDNEKKWNTVFPPLEPLLDHESLEINAAFEEMVAAFNQL